MDLIGALRDAAVVDGAGRNSALQDAADRVAAVYPSTKRIDLGRYYFAMARQAGPGYQAVREEELPRSASWEMKAS